MQAGASAWGLPGDEDVLAALHERRFIYELGHVVFGGKPDRALLDTLAGDDCSAMLDRVAETCASAAGLLSWLGAYRAAGDAERGQIVVDCASSYNGVVLGLGAGCAAHPWESFYTSQKQLLFQVETLEVRCFYKEFGYELARLHKVPDDHLSLECAFMTALADKTIDAFESEEEAEVARLREGQLRFLREHLNRWASPFAADVRQDCRGLYGQVASLLEDCARADEAFLGSRA